MAPDTTTHSPDTATSADGRQPMCLSNCTSTFGIMVLAFLSANLLPLMIIALRKALDIGATAAGTIMTLSLLATALTALATARWCEGRGRVGVARSGLVLMAVGFGVTAVHLGTAATVAGVIVGGIGAGCALASSGAAMAALRNPERASGLSGLVNRAVVTVVLAVVPLLGIGMGTTFGAVAGSAVLVVLCATWLPVATIATITGTTSDSAAPAEGVGEPTTAPTAPAVAGIVLLASFALWGIAEDSLWAMGGTIGTTQAGLSESQLGFALSVATAGGFVASLVIVALGARTGRALPLGAALLLGAALKLTASVTHDPTLFLVAFIVWQTLYSVAFLYFLSTAAALDPSGRWSGPLFGAYLVGSSFAPVFGAWLADTFGYATFGVVLAALSLVVLVPALYSARISTGLEGRLLTKPAGTAPLTTLKAAGV